MDKRLPPGQQWIDEPLIYDINKNFSIPEEKDIYLYIVGEVKNPLKIPYLEIINSGNLSKIKADFHCVTGWSVKDIEWEGILAKRIIEAVKPAEDVKWVYVRCYDGYSASFPYEFFKKDDSLIAVKMNGKILPKEHGYPFRVVVPSLYAWKSAKYVHTVEFLKDEKKGFWELRGYHAVGDPWKEERYG